MIVHRVPRSRRCTRGARVVRAVVASRAVVACGAVRVLGVRRSWNAIVPNTAASHCHQTADSIRDNERTNCTKDQQRHAGRRAESAAAACCNDDAALHRVPRSFQLCTTPHAPRAVLFSVAMRVEC